MYMATSNHHNPHNDRCNDAESLNDLCETCWAGYSEWLADGSLDGWVADVTTPV
jgi:hypothetical protein